MSTGGARRGGELIALLVMRWSGMAMAAGFALAGMWVEVAVAMLVALAQVVGWRSRLPLPWEAATSGACVIAAVSSFLLLYERIPWWDVPIHFLLTGLVAVLVTRVVRSRTPRASEVVVTGVILAVVWELMELAGHHWVDPTVYVAPADTVGDIVSGLAGAVTAGLLWRRRGAESPSPTRTR